MCRVQRNALNEIAAGVWQGLQLSDYDQALGPSPRVSGIHQPAMAKGVRDRLWSVRCAVAIWHPNDLPDSTILPSGYLCFFIFFFFLLNTFGATRRSSSTMALPERTRASH